MEIDVSSIKNDLGIDVLYFPSIDSTSLYCKERLRSGGPFEGIVIASHQTNGQGRVGKSFYSPKDSGLYFTICLKRDKFPADDLTPRVALAVCEAIEQHFDVSCGVKWVNDIYCCDRKICGILCQSVDDYYLIGIGINLQKPNVIPRELKERMGWICDEADPHVRSALIRTLYRALCRFASVKKNEILDQYRSRCVHIGSNVEIQQNLTSIFGKCVGIGEDFELLVEINGVLKSFTSGYMVLKI